MPRFDPTAIYPIDLSGGVIFDAPLPDGKRTGAYEQPEITTQPGTACERLVKRGQFGVAPSLPTTAVELSKETRAVLLHLSRAAVESQTDPRRKRKKGVLEPIDRSGLGAGAIALKLHWMRDQGGKPSPDAERARRLLEAMIRVGLLVRVEARYTTPQIAGVEAPETAIQAAKSTAGGTGEPTTVVPALAQRSMF